MRIGLFAWSLFTGKGGIERFASRISNYLLSRGHQCVLYHQGSGKGQPIYALRDGVKTCDLALKNAASVKLARHLIQEANLDVFCVMNSSNIRLWFPAIFNKTGIPLLMSERCAPNEVETIIWNRPERLASFAAADGIHLLSDRYLSSLPSFLLARATAIPNPAPPLVPIDWSKEYMPKKQILVVARLEELQKKISIFIRAFGLLVERFSDWDCCICGDGPDRALYEEMIQSMGLTERVKLLGSVDNVDHYYKTSHIFCLPSAYEGSPNALLEAQSYGLPSVGFSTCSGVNEIIVHDENGLLVSQINPAILAESLACLMESESLRRNMGGRAQTLAERYDEMIIFEKWENMLMRVASHKNHTHLNYPPVSDEEMAYLVLREILARECPMEDRAAAQHRFRKINMAAQLRLRLAGK